SISVDTRRVAIEGVRAKDWLRGFFIDLCQAMAPAWGCVRHPDEYAAKVMTEPPRIEAIGRDFGRFLPGLFWLNFFGPKDVGDIGRDRLLSAPASKVEPLGKGVLIGLGDEAPNWSGSGARAMEERVNQHLGPRFFFRKDAS